MNIYVSNISYTATDEALQAAFAVYGEVTSARIIKDRLTSRSRGFGFVEMANEEEGKKALEALTGFDLMGRTIAVREARPREEGEKKQGGQGEKGEKVEGGEGGEPRAARQPREQRGERNNNNGGQRQNGRNRGEGREGREGREPREPRDAQPQPELVIIQRGMY